MDDKVITSEELAAHTQESDIWLSIHGKVYNVTNYLADHPGGMDVMLEHAGKDATEEFEYYGHSDKARKQLTEFLVGTYEKGDSVPVAESTQAKAAVVARSKPSLLSKIVQALLPLLLIAAAVLYQLYRSKSSEAAGPR